MCSFANTVFIMKQLCDHCARINGGKSCLYLGDKQNKTRWILEAIMAQKCLILQIFFLNFIHHFGFPWCTLDLKTLLVLFDSDCRRCFTCSCVYLQGITQGNTWGQWELIPPIVLYQKHGSWLPQVLGKVRDIKISSKSENIHLWKKSGKIWSNYLAF